MEKRYKPVAKLGIIPVPGSEKLASKVDEYIMKWRRSSESFIINCDIPRFQSGEAKAHLLSSIRGKDLYIVVDVLNHGLEYELWGRTNVYSPDDHYQNLKRVISAVGGKGHRLTVIMPFLYEGRQHKRSSRESLDCSVMLRELENMGVNSLITFDAHDPRVQNSVCILNFENVSPSYQFVKSIVEDVNGIQINKDSLMVVSPDEGATQRSIFLSSVLGLDMGMFYKRRDFTKVVNGKNPILAHEFLGSDVTGKDIIIIDDMISSGESMLDVASQLKGRGANRIICVSTFGLFSGGYKKFDEAYKNGIIYKVLSTNLIFQEDELINKEWYISVDMNEYVAALIDNLNCDNSISGLISPAEKIKEYMEATGNNLA